MVTTPASRQTVSRRPGNSRIWRTTAAALSSRKGTTRAELKYLMWDVVAGILVSQVIAYFVQIATAATLHENGQTHIQSAADAARALQPLAGGAAGLLFAVGLIGV